MACKSQRLKAVKNVHESSEISQYTDLYDF